MTMHRNAQACKFENKIKSNFIITCIKEVKLNQFHHKFKNYMNLCKLKIMEFPIHVSKPHVRTYSLNPYQILKSCVLI